MVEEMQSRDVLTGLEGHDAFVAALDSLSSDADEAGDPVSLAVVDIDEFLEINHTHGHAIGDEVIKAVVAHLSGALPEGAAYRYGGDEFAVLLPGVDKETAFLACEQMREGFSGERTFTADGGEAAFPVTISVGIATYPDDGKPADVVRKAHDAIYRAKATGRNRVCLAREERMVTKTSHYTQGQLERLSQLAGREGVGEAVLLREALDDLLRRYST